MKKAYIFNWMMMLSVPLIILSSCTKDPGPEPDPDPGNGNGIPAEVLTLNNWIWEGMNDVYLWEQYIPDLDPDKESDPEEFFYKLLYKDDRDSWIVDDYDALIQMFQGVQLTTGMSARPGYINDTDVISIIEYVTPGSPAAQAGVERGDIIISIDDTPLNGENYFDLYYQTTATYQFGRWNGSEVVANGVEVTLTAIELSQNPIVHSEVIDYEGSKVGYFVYTQFTKGQDNEWFDAVNDLLQEFSDAGVNEVVVDLRYNGGGNLDLSAYIASALAPLSPAQNNDVYIRLLWNQAYNNYWKQADLDNDGEPDGDESSQLVISLREPQFNLDLSRVYFLTTDGTASASESLMTGLYPYMEVIQIGTTTYGKCYGSVTIDDWEDPKRHNWAMQPIVLKYANALGFTDFVEGITPDYEVEDNLLTASPFGSLNDPLLAKALEDISGVSPARKSAAVMDVPFKNLPVERIPLPELAIPWPGEEEPRTLY